MGYIPFGELMLDFISIHLDAFCRWLLEIFPYLNCFSKISSEVLHQAIGMDPNYLMSLQ